MEFRETRLRVGNLVVSLETEAGVEVSGCVDSFVVDAPSEATIRVRSGLGIPSGEWHEQLSVVEDGLATAEDIRWSAFRAPDGESVVIHRTGLGLLMQYAPGSSCNVVDVLLGPADVAGGAPARGPGRELALVAALPLPVVVLLAGRQGLFLHSCAVNDSGEGILFSGVSGSGKSTMAELWRNFGPPSTAVIDDEHIIAHRVGDQMLLHGAPWRRGLREARTESAPLRAIFFLSHGVGNRCIPLSPADALAQLMSQVFLPVWSREQVELTMQTCADVVQEADCYHLEFVPQPDVVGFVRGVLAGSR
jgi:hypothetical protein